MIISNILLHISGLYLLYHTLPKALSKVYMCLEETRIIKQNKQNIPDSIHLNEQCSLQRNSLGKLCKHFNNPAIAQNVFEASLLEFPYDPVYEPYEKNHSLIYSHA